MSRDRGATPTAGPPLQLFCQLEFSHHLGVPAGTYPANAGDVVAVEVVDGTPAATTKAWGRRRPADPAERPAVPLTLTTLLRTVIGQPAQLLDRLRSDKPAQLLFRDDTLALINRAIRAARAAVGDPYAIEVTAADARACRIGLATYEQLQAGTPHGVFDVRERLRRKPLPRAEHVRITQEVAASLQGHAYPFDAEDIALRALLDLQHGREAAAESQAKLAVDVLRRELGQPKPETEPGPPLTPAEIDAVARHVLQVAAAQRADQLQALRRDRGDA